LGVDVVVGVVSQSYGVVLGGGFNLSKAALRLFNISRRERRVRVKQTTRHLLMTATCPPSEPFPELLPIDTVANQMSRNRNAARNVAFKNSLRL
jgi:hypothetical protein